MTNRAVNRRIVIQGAAASGLVSVLGLSGCDSIREPSSRKLHGQTMGTTYTVRLPRIPPDIIAADLQLEIHQTLSGINERMSTFRADSELSQFNNYAGSGWFRVSADTAKVVTQAIAVSNLTNGTFDISAGPLVELWGFGPGTRRQNRPTIREIAALRGQTNTDELDVSTYRPALRKSKPEIRIDLSGIAKGFAVDRLAELFVARGIKNFLVEVGGEIRVKGKNSRGRPWSIGIERPIAGRQPLQRIINLGEGAVATSGDYRNWYRLGGQRYSHIIDPRSGMPVSHSLASVTVIDHSAMNSDALSTGLMVMGPDEGRDVVLRADIAALFVVRRNNRLEEWASPAFRQIAIG